MIEAKDNQGCVWKELTAGSSGRAQVFQTSLMAALLQGVYEGEMTFDELRAHGDFGLGTFNELDGEMVACGGEFFQLRSDGSAQAVSLQQKTPFSVVTFFRPKRECTFPGLWNKETLFGELEGATEANLFSAIQIVGEFSTVTTRTVGRQTHPFPPLTTAAEHEAIKVQANVKGALVGFRTPAFAQGIGVAGFHLHFLTENKTAGGHVLEFTAKNAVVQIATLGDLHIQLPTTRTFLSAELADSAVDRAIKQSEG